MRRATICRVTARRSSVCARRRGLSLIEVILATAILMGSVIVLARLAGMGHSTGQKAEQYAEAQRVCEQTLNEIVLGLRPLEPVQQAQWQPAATFVDQSDRTAQANSTAALFSVQRSGSQWIYSVQTRSVEEVRGLTLLSVAVNSAIPEGSMARSITFRLSRWIRIPLSEESSSAIDSPLLGDVQ